MKLIILTILTLAAFILGYLAFPTLSAIFHGMEGIR